MPNMSRSPRSPSRWPAFPGIPIYLEAHDERVTAKTYGTTPTTPTTPEVLSHERPTHLSPAHTYETQPTPIDPSPTTTIQTSSDRSAIWPISEPPPEIQCQQEPRRPALRFFPTQRPRVRLDNIPSLQIPVADEKTPISSMLPGLGIVDGPPKPPSIEVSAPQGEGEVESSPNLAERIEKRLYQYSISGNIIKRWLLEIISWIFSAMCMAAIIAVLFTLKDDPLTNWSWATKIGLTLNAYISILSKMAGASLLLPVSEALGQLKWSWFQQNSKQMWDFEIFDNASRGPWGSLLLLIRTKGRALAALGAMITLCLMALDPFFQQVVDFPARWTLSDTNSTIPRTLRYDPGLGKEFRDGIPVATNDPDLFHVVEKFAYGNGTQPLPFENGTRPEIPLSCPTSKCTWPVYETLGVCSQCADISSYLKYTCVTGRIDWTSNLDGGYSAQEKYPNGTMCGYFLNATSEHPILMSGRLMDANESTADETLLMRTLPLLDAVTREPYFGNGSILFKHMRNTIVDVLIVAAANASIDTVHMMIPPIAQECVLSWCVKTIKSSYGWGKYEEEVVEAFSNTTAGLFPWEAFPFVDEFGSGTDIFYMQDVNIDANTSDGRSVSGYGTSNRTAYSVIQAFLDIFPSFSTSTNDADVPVLRYKIAREGFAYNRQLEYNPWIYPNVSLHMDRLATAMTNVVRSAASKEMLPGEAFSRETYVRVRWVWLTLPLGLLGMSFIFLLATIFKSAIEKEQVGVLKNSAILTLLYGVSDEIRGKLTRSASTGTPRAKAKELKVKLNSNMGWRVSGNLFSPLVPRPPRQQPPPGWI